MALGRAAKDVVYHEMGNPKYASSNPNMTKNVRMTKMKRMSKMSDRPQNQQIKNIEQHLQQLKKSKIYGRGFGG